LTQTNKNKKKREAKREEKAKEKLVETKPGQSKFTQDKETDQKAN
jgi:hypothetical protein